MGVSYLQLPLKQLLTAAIRHVWSMVNSDIGNASDLGHGTTIHLYLQGNVGVLPGLLKSSLGKGSLGRFILSF